jgi:hypothetical protein
MSRTFLPMLCFVIGLLVLACGNPDTNKNGPANVSGTTAAPAPSAAATVAAGDQIGIPECDNFITAYETCVTTRVPDAAREQYRAAVVRWRADWKKLAADPQTRAGLVQACKTQMETARTQMKSFNCTF